MHGPIRITYLVCFVDPLSGAFTPLENITDHYIYISVTYFVKVKCLFKDAFDF